MALGTRKAPLLLSGLEIDVDKDWGTRVIKNLGAPAVAGDAVKFPARRADLEYPTEDVSFEYLLSIGKASVGFGRAWDSLTWDILSLDSFADRRIKVVMGGQAPFIFARSVDVDNGYTLRVDTGRVTEDHRILKYVAGTGTVIAIEAVDFGPEDSYFWEFEWLGSNFKSFRQSTTPQLSGTDTDIASGRWGFGGYSLVAYNTAMWPYLAKTGSRSPEVLKYFEVPVIGL